MKFGDVAHLYIGCKCQYKGIVNGNELKQEEQILSRLSDEDYAFYLSSTPHLDPIYDLKIGNLKVVRKNKNNVKLYVGNKNQGLKSFTFVNSTIINDDFIKPILYPLSSITEQQIKYIASISNVVYRGEPIEDMVRLWKAYEPVTFHYLLSNHFDLFGLIDSGDAIDVTKLEINPYQKKKK